MSFKKDSHQVLSDAAKNKSPIKLTGFKRKANFRDNSLQDIEIGSKTAVILLENVSFKYSACNIPLAKATNIKSVIENGYDKQMVTVIGYVNIGDSYQSVLNEHSKLMEVNCNDANDTITLVLWNHFIDEIKESGVYSLGNLMVKQPSQDDSITLTTTKDTLISKSSKILGAIETIEFNCIFFCERFYD